MHKITNLWKFELYWSSKLRDYNEQKKNTLSHEVVCFQMITSETSNSKSEVSKSNSWKMTSFSKTIILQRKLFLTMFYTINSSPLLVTNYIFYANNYFEWLPIVSTCKLDAVDQSATIHYILPYWLVLWHHTLLSHYYRFWLKINSGSSWNRALGVLKVSNGSRLTTDSPNLAVCIRSLHIKKLFRMCDCPQFMSDLENPPI